MSDRVLVAPPGLTRPDQFAERNIQPMPTPPRPANNLVVGGPAYFTPEGYQAPVQPQEAFMPTRTGYDPIRDQFNRPPAPMPMPAPAPAPTPAPPPTGGVGDPAPYVPAPAPAPAPQDDDPLLPPGYSYTPPTGRAYTAVMPFRPGARYAYGPDGDRIEVGGDPDYEPQSFPMGPEENTPTPAPEPVFTPPPTMPEPNGFFPNMNFEDLDFSGLPNLNLEDMDFSELPQYQMPPPPPPPPAPKTAKELAMENYSPTGMTNEQLKKSYDIGLPIPKADYPNFEAYLASLSAPAPTMPAPVQTQGIPIGEMPVPPEVLARKKRQEEEREAESIKNAIAKYGSVENRQKSVRESLATPAPIYTPPPKMEEMFEDYDYGNPNLRNRGMFGPRR
tara:strand:- start:457 stop:1623 length:1167 start_codon:yes stop_codon:yes gene_type:complete